MRPWIKGLTVGGVLGVTLSVGWAAERLPERREPVAKRPSRPGQQEYFSRSHSAAVEPDVAVDPEIENLTAEASALPKKFTRQKGAASESAASAKKDTRRSLEAELFGEEVESLSSTPKTATSQLNSAAKPGTKATGSAVAPSRQPAKQSSGLKAIRAESVELLPSPDSEVAEEDIAATVPRQTSAVAIPPAGQQPITKQVTQKISKATVPAGDEGRDGIIGAAFSQSAGAKSGIRQINGTAEPSTLKPLSVAPLPLKPPAMQPLSSPSRVSIVTDRAAKGAAATAARSARAMPSSARETSHSSASTAGTPAVSVEWVKRSEINVGQECSCDLIVKNTGRVVAREVIVDAHFPASVRLTQAEPEPEQATDHLEWTFAELAAGEERVIHITMIPSQRGELATTANVRFTGTAANVFKVEEPLLKVEAQAPADVVVGDPLVQTVTVTNPGSGVAQNVQVRVTTSEGLQNTRADRSQIDIGALSPGESRTVRLSFTAMAGGEQSLEIEATADSGLKQVTESTIRVVAPALKVAIDGPGLRYVGRDSKFTLTVTNDGQAATNNVRVTHRIPSGFKFVKADKGGTFDAAQGTVSWFVGHLEASQSAQLKLHLQASELGDFEHLVQATSEHGIVAKTEATTKIEGSASLVLEIHDLDDPVEVGQETAYEIRVSNTGSKAADNVSLAFELPAGLELLNVESPTDHLAKNGLILFNDLANLAPGKTALFRVHVRGETDGNQRVRARLASESIDQELITEELTKFYGE